MKKTHRILAVVLAVVMVCGAFGVLATSGQVSKLVDYANITVNVDGKKVDMVDAAGNAVEPFAISGTTYVPLRAVSTALGYSISWDSATSEITISEKPIDVSSGITDGTVNLYLVRHGKTIMNTMNLVQGWSDSPLTEAGVQVAEQAAAGMSDLIFDYVYASDRGRAIETAEIILAGSNTSSGRSITTMQGLRETFFGSFEGQSNPTMWNAIANYHGYDDYETFMASDAFDAGTFFSVVPEIDPTGTAETHEEVVERLVASFNQIVSEVSAKGGGNVLVVGHGASLLTSIGQLCADVELPSGGLINASLSKVVYKDGVFTCEFVNDTSYIEAGQKQLEAQDNPVVIYLTRHGKTLFNTSNQTQGWIDSPLTEAGREVATNLGKGLADVEFSGVYTSGMGRAVETAQLVLAENRYSSNLPIHNYPGIRETNYGKYEGGDNNAMLQVSLDYYGVSSLDDIATEDQSMLERVLYVNYITDETGEAENLFELLSRVSTEFENIVQDASANGGGNILVVSHGNAIMAVLEHLGIKDAGDIKNASVTKIIYANGAYTVETINDLSYAEAGAKK